MMRPSQRVAVIGAGTAGLATAIALARVGCAVDLFERHGGLAAHGAGLLIQPQGVAALAALGVGPAFLDASLPIVHLHGKTRRGWTLVDIAYRDQPARGVSRAALSQVLFDAAVAAGVQMHFNAAVDAISVHGSSAELAVGGQRHRVALAVIANGASSTFPAEVGLAAPATAYRWGALWGMFDVADWPHEQRLLQRFHTTRQMMGLLPTARSGERLRLSLFWSLPCDRYEAWRSAPLADWLAQAQRLWPEAAPVLAQIRSHDQLTFASYHHARPARLARAPLCIVGDAAHAMSPQLGLGSTLAVQDALLLAHSIAEHGMQHGPADFSRRRRLTVRAYQTLSRLMTPCFQADGNGWWRDLAFAGGLLLPGTRGLMYAVSPSRGRARRYCRGYRSRRESCARAFRLRREARQRRRRLRPATAAKPSPSNSSCNHAVHRSAVESNRVYVRFARQPRPTSRKLP
ncbi:MAG: FAD-dependent monooxygenase [Pseudomonadota bacterium]|nr:FAD-dependent monooxygenase [Pseudomonadota bacterium]